MLAAPASAEKPPASDAEAPSELPERLVPLRTRTSVEQDRIEALALYAAARTLEDQEDYTGALRLYQRALRFDPESVSILEQIVPLALSLNRQREAARYALTAIEIAPDNEPLLRRLAGVLSDEGNRAGALKLYERSAAILGAAPNRKALLVLVRLEMGRLYFLEERHREAAEVFAQAIPALDRPADYGLDEETRKGLFKNPVGLYELIGEIFIKAERPDDAEGAFGRAVAAAEMAAAVGGDPDDPPPAAEVKAKSPFRAAQVLRLRKQPDAALAELDRYFQSHDASVESEALELLKEIYVSQDRRDQLLARLELLYEGRSESPARLAALAAEQLERGQLDAAGESFERLTEEEPELSDLVHLVSIRRQQGDAVGLFRALTRLADAGHDFDNLRDEGRSILDNDELVTAVLKTATDSGETLDRAAAMAAGDLALADKRYESADGFYTRALAAESENTQQAQLLLGWGLGLFRDEKYAEATSVFARAVAARLLPEGNPLFEYYHATALELSGQTDEALRVLDEALLRAPDAIRLTSRRAWVLYHAKRYAEAEEAHRVIVAQYGDKQANPDVVEAVKDARLLLSHLCVLTKRLDEAEEWLEQVLDENPEDVSASNDLGYLWADRGKHLDRALEMAKRAVAAEPENRAYLDTLGWVYYRLGRFGEAVELLEKAIDRAKPEAEVLDHLGDAYLAAGQREKAIDAWQRAWPHFDKAADGDKMKATREKLEKLGVTVEP